MKTLALLVLWFPAAAWSDPPAGPGGLELQAGLRAMPQCDTLPPDAEFRHYTGYGIAGSEIQALHAAREDAYQIARDALCTGDFGKAKCERIVGELAQLDEQAHYVRRGYPRRERWRACFTLQIPRKWADIEYLQQELKRDLRSLGMQVAARHGATPLRVEPPTWAESQCSVGGAGEVLVSEIAGAFAPVGVRIQEGDPLAPSLRVLLARSGEHLDMVTTHVAPDGTEDRFPPVRFFPELYGLERDVEASCRWDRELGLVEGHRAGADGRYVRVVIPGNTGEFCEGDRMEPMVVVDRPSRVRVYSVERDGSALVIWPYLPSQDDLVTRTLSLGQAQVQRPKIGEERLIAVAIPADADFGDTADWRACRWPGPFDASAFPEGAAVGSVGFLVAPEGTEGCPEDVSLVPIPELPVCGT